MTEYIIPMITADDYAREHYGITFKSACVYRVAGSSAPTRVKVWDNTRRPNPRNGEPVRYGEFGPRDGGNGEFLDPHNRATDARVSVLLSPESSVISAHRNGTGTVASGQVYAPGDARLRTGDVLVLVHPDGSHAHVTVRMTNNGHGVAE